MKHFSVVSGGLLLLPVLLLHDVVIAADADAIARQEAVVRYFEGPDQPLVEKAAWTAERVFNVGVHYGGVSEDGMASDVCAALTRHDVARNIRVRVIDINSMNGDPARWKEIGRAACR